MAQTDGTQGHDTDYTHIASLAQIWTNARNRYHVHVNLDLDVIGRHTLPGATLFHHGGPQVELEERLGIPVDVLMPGDLPSKFRDQAPAQAVPI
jgi:predicted nucleotidyltransferase